MCNCNKNENLTIKIKKLDPNLPDLEKIKIGNWIDLRVSKISRLVKKSLTEINWVDNNYLLLEKDTYYLFHLGFACQIPKGYEGYILPRSSTFKNYKCILTNSKGIIDNFYCGENDEYIASFFTLGHSTVHKYDRVVQFRIQEVMPEITIEYVEKLNNPDRNGFGSTGKK